MKTEAITRVEIDLAKGFSVSDEMLGRGLRAVGVDSEAQLKGVLSRPGTGRIYKRGTVSHRASSPGEAPAPDTGRLRNSVSHDVILTGNRGEVTLVANTEYAAALQMGTEKIQPRPFMTIFLNENTQRIAAVFKKYAGL